MIEAIGIAALALLVPKLAYVAAGMMRVAREDCRRGNHLIAFIAASLAAILAGGVAGSVFLCLVHFLR